MDFNTAKEVVLNSNENLYNQEHFFRHTILKKIENYTPEHILILKTFHEIAEPYIEETKKLQEKNPDVSTFIDITFNMIIEKTALSKDVINVCFNDLESDGFIIMTNRNLYTYYITPYGIKLIDMLKVEDN